MIFIDVVECQKKSLGGSDEEKVLSLTPNWEDQAKRACVDPLLSRHNVLHEKQTLQTNLDCKRGNNCEFISDDDVLCRFLQVTLWSQKHSDVG